MTEREGVIKFDLRFTPGSSTSWETIRELDRWRSVLFEKKLLGQDPHRYEGLGFGNVSQRILPSHKTSLRPFVISGTQTGHLPSLTADHYTKVLECDPDKNLIVAAGPVRPSSESLTHGTIYALDETIRFIMHVHSPDIWRSAKRLGIARTRAEAAYGTPEMAEEVRRLFRTELNGNTGIFSMDGHEDGVVAFADTAEKAGQLLLGFWERAKKI